MAAVWATALAAVESDRDVNAAAALLNIDASAWKGRGWPSYSTTTWAAVLERTPMKITAIRASNTSSLDDSMLRTRRWARIGGGHHAYPTLGAAEVPHADIFRDPRGLAYSIYGDALAAKWGNTTNRSYLLASGANGWGNRNRLMVFAFTLAVATNRVLLFERGKSAPFYPHLFRPPYSPWVSSTAEVQRWVGRSRRVFPLSVGYGRGTGHVLCWEQKQSLSACGLTPAVRLVHVTGTNDRSALIARTPELVAALDARVNAACERRVRRLAPIRGDDASGTAARLAVRVCAAHTRHNWPSLVMSALFGSHTGRLAAPLAAARRSLNWRSNSSAVSLVVAVHYRAFVDVAQRAGLAVDASFWDCAARRIREAQALLSSESATSNTSTSAGPGRRVGAAHTLIFVATDKPELRAIAHAQLGGLGAVRTLRSTAKMVHSDHLGPAASASAIAAAAGVLTEWLLLSEADLVIGTLGSSFSTTAAILGSVPQVLAGYKPGATRPRMRELRGGSSENDDDDAAFEGGVREKPQWWSASGRSASSMLHVNRHRRMADAKRTRAAALPTGDLATCLVFRGGREELTFAERL